MTISPRAAGVLLAAGLIAGLVLGRSSNAPAPAGPSKAEIAHAVALGDSVFALRIALGRADRRDSSTKARLAVLERAIVLIPRHPATVAERTDTAPVITPAPGTRDTIEVEPRVLALIEAQRARIGTLEASLDVAKTALAIAERSALAERTLKEQSLAALKAERDSRPRFGFRSGFFVGAGTVAAVVLAVAVGL